MGSISKTRLDTFSSRRQWATLAVLIAGQFVLWLDNTILNVSLKTLADPVAGLGASPSQLEWAISSYMLIFATLLFTGGALADRYGRRRVFIGGMLVFGAGSAWAAYAASPVLLIVARGVMGAGCAMVMPAALAMINKVFDEKQRATAIAMWSGFTGLAIAAGPLIGGALIENFWWGSIFLVNVPVTVVSIVAALAIIPETRNPNPTRFDPLGLVLSCAGIFAIVYGVIEGGRSGDWGRPAVWVPVGVGVVLLALFVRVERAVVEPGFDLNLFRDSRFAGSSAAITLLFFGVSGFMFITAFYLLGVRELAPLRYGVVLLPVAIGLLVGAPLGTALAARSSTRTVAIIGLVLVSGSFASLALMTRSSAIGWFELLAAAQGLGVGAVVAPTTDVIMSVLPKEQSGSGSAMSSATRQFGSVLGVAVLGSVLASVYRHGIQSALNAVDLPRQQLNASAASAEATRRLAAVLGRPELSVAADNAYLHAMRISTVTAAVVAVLGVPVLYLGLRARRTKTAEQPTSGESICIEPSEASS